MSAFSFRTQASRAATNANSIAPADQLQISDPNDVLNIIRAALNDMSLRYVEESDMVGIRMNFRNNVSDYVFVARLNEQCRTIKLIGTSFKEVQLKWIRQAAEFAARVNLKLPIGYFAIEQESRELRFYFDVSYDLLPNSAALREVFQESMSYCLATFAKYIEPIALMTSEDLSGRAAAELIETPERTSVFTFEQQHSSPLGFEPSAHTQLLEATQAPMILHSRSASAEPVADTVSSSIPLLHLVEECMRLRKFTSIVVDSSMNNVHAVHPATRGCPAFTISADIPSSLNNTLVIRSHFDGRIGKDRLTSTVRMLAQLNLSLDMGCFDIDVASGEVRFATSLACRSLSFAVLKSSYIGALFDVNIRTFQNYQSIVYTIVSGIRRGETDRAALD